MEDPKPRAYENLRYRIMTHDLRPGELLNERELMAAYGIGRTPLREVLLELQRDGLIQRFPRSGTFVAPLDLHLFRQVIEIRINLEGFAAQLAAERITEAELEGLSRVLERVEELKGANSENLEPLTQCEFDFHNRLSQATHNRKLGGILHELHGISARFWHYLVFSREELLDQFKDHRDMIDALAERDAQRARRIMERHIQRFVDKVRESILK
ncbi:MAG: GntR family transcriptional regulator [Deltaproteobacteria bacterium]|nr:GntR family transcriptional regulator [Deltaproteobacteria bacterium]